MHNIKLQKRLTLLAIGFGISIFLTISVLTWSTISIVLRIGLIVICVSAFFVGMFSLSKNYETNSEKDDTTNEQLSVVVTDNTNQGTDYHQTDGPATSILLLIPIPIFRRIINLFRRGVKHNVKEPVASTA